MTNIITESGDPMVTEIAGDAIVTEINIFTPPPGASYPRTRTPTWDTVVQQGLAGQTTGIQLRPQPLWQWEMPINVMRGTVSLPEWQEMADFINGLGGRTGYFYYDDPDDDTATDELFGYGDGSTTAFQLGRALVLGGYIEPIQFPSGVPTVSIGGSPTSAFTLSVGGIVTFDSAPASGELLTWTGSYLWLCRLDEDKYGFDQIDTYLRAIKKISWSQVLI